MIKSDKVVSRLIFWSSLIIIIITIFAYYDNDYLLKKRDEYFFDTEKLGHFGDFVGGFLGTILTIAATIFVYKTYISQKNELQLQRALISQQQFETTFFNMLELHRNIKNSLSINIYDLITKPYIIGITSDNMSINTGRLEDFDTLTGKKVFIKLIEDFERLYNHFPHINPDYRISSEIDDKIENNGYGLLGTNTCDIYNTSSDLRKLKFKYDIFHAEHFKLIGDYLRNVYHILKFLSNKKKEFSLNNININVKDYADIFQSQMSYMELALVFYNGFKFRKARKLIKEFNFIENVHQSNLLLKDLKIPSLGNIKSK